MITCNNGIAIPTLIPNECLGKYTSTDCSLSPNANIILELPSGASQTETNAALTTALVYKEQQIEDLQNSILTIDGSETKVEAGDNVTVTGTGTNLNPYVVNAVIGVNQDLQSVLDTGNYAESSSGRSLVDLLHLKNDEYNHFLKSGSEIEINNFTELELKSEYFRVTQKNINGNGGFFSIIEGAVTIHEESSIGTTDVYFESPSVSTGLLFPAKTIIGDYTINTTDNTMYTVSMLPLATLNDMAIVSDATAPTYLGALTGGGTVVCPVWYNGTIWVSR